MAQTLLAICQQASREMGITAPATIISNTDTYAVTLLNLFNGIGQDLQREYQWQRLTLEHSFTTVFFEYTADTTSGSTTISNMSSTTGLTSAPTRFNVSGTGIPDDTFLVSVNGGASSAVLTRAATATGTTVTLTFAQTMYALPSDYDRLVNNTEWDKSNFRPIYGPDTAQQWQFLKGGLVVSASPYVQFRIMGNLFQIWPPQAAENYYRFEYISNLWGATSASAALTLSALTADTDTNAFPDRLMIETLKLRYRLSLGRPDYTSLYPPEDVRARYPLRILDIAKAGDAGSPTLSMSPRGGSYLLGERNIPETGYGS